MTSNEWQTMCTSSNIVPTSETILEQALPESLAAPTGWRSEILRSSSSLSNHSGTNLINSNTGFFEQSGDYKTLNTTDSSPIIFSSINETNRIVNEIPSSTILPSTTISSNSVNEYINTPIYDNLSQEQRTILTKDWQSSTTNINNQQQEPIIVHKKLPNGSIVYQQNVSVRYLQPPTPPPPEPIIIREVRPPPPPPKSPIKVRQRPPPPPTPPPLVIRERPPPAPPRLPTQIIEKLLPPPPRPPRRMIVERFAECPPKPADVLIERWLPYKRTDRRQILFERASAPYIPSREPNLLILHDQPNARIHKEFINQGVTRADPQTYLQRYGAEIDSWQTNSRYAHLISEADRALPPPHPLAPTSNAQEYYGSYSNRYPSSPIAAAWERMRSASPLPHSMPYDQNYSNRYPSSPISPISTIWERMKSVSPLPPNYSQYNSPYRSSTQSPLNYNDYATHRGDMRTMIDVTPSWGRTCGSYLPSYDFSSSYPPKTLQVNSDGQFRHTLSSLTSGHVPTSFNSY